MSVVQINNDVSLIAILAAASLLPFLVAVGTCYIKFSVVFTLIRNALGLQQVPSNMVINALSLILAFYVMHPIVTSVQAAYQELGHPLTTVQETADFLDNSLGEYRAYLARHADPELLRFFERAQVTDGTDVPAADTAAEDRSLFALLPAYALSELKDAFLMGFYLYLPFIVVDLIVSSILLALGMMMMSPVTISAPIKLILFVVLDGWSLLSQGLVMQYMDVPA
ncbi:MULTISPECIES: EscR/YscR/HrcR family type III secretion system export apparatus protein [unclassified Stenotrophomonas]|jgi:type III secretion system export apparatus protein|uniref:EscR/YscR/HrcR family type III secretion system export apparatus protein n=1 Tax=unclassified Stenotrophomonas TaxID=196198 RepID=UPI0018D63E38|nr:MULTISPECIES: EscR/YscR/HrcR family type III secretion system export apparatus protein [unclassified Stenotrophomonas]MDY1034422.1 EscR/YscR/HrcR family type III secretion system export apparatus protein [Stenotrophomonas sp. CFBP8980]